MSRMRATVLGCGTSTGVPVIGCRCATCRSSDPGNRRSRASLWLRFEDDAGRERSVVVDTSTDFRSQALREGIERLDALLFTHAHADHIFGLDDVRVYNFRQRASIPCYGSEATLATLKRSFAYVFEDGQEGGGKPSLDLHAVSGPFELFGREIVPIPVLHGSMPVLGFRLGSFAYVTDVNYIPETSFTLLRGVESLVLGALRYRPHPTHFNLEEALEAAARIGARRVWLTHLACEIDVTAPRRPLPAGVEFALDGLELEVADPPQLLVSRERTR